MECLPISDQTLVTVYLQNEDGYCHGTKSLIDFFSTLKKVFFLSMDHSDEPIPHDGVVQVSIIKQ